MSVAKGESFVALRFASSAIDHLRGFGAAPGLSHPFWDFRRQGLDGRVTAFVCVLRSKVNLHAAASAASQQTDPS